MHSFSLWQRLAVPLLLCFVVSMLTSRINSNERDRVATEFAESPASTGEEEEQQHSRPFATLCHRHTYKGSPLLDLARATDDRLLPSPHGEVLLRPPKQLL